MADAMALAGDIVSCSGLMLLFLLLTEPRYPMRRTAALLSAVFAATAAAYIAAVLGLGLMPGQASLVCFSIPSLTACLLISKTRDGRFLFPFCTNDVLRFMLIAVSRISAVLLGGDDWLRLLFRLALIGLLVALFLRIRGNYRRVMAEHSTGWGMLAAVSVLFYAMLYLLVTYPAPLIGRREYIPVVLFFCATVLATYVVIYQAIVRMVKLSESEQSELLLQTRLELQKSQLELQQVYYRMAYVDSLTGLANRASFERRRKEIEADLVHNRPVWCVSADLNNLKEVNDARGHEWGDRLLRETGQLLTRLLGEAFEIFRLGGDEFILLSCGTPSDKVSALLGKLYPAIEAHNAAGNLPVSLAVGWDSLREGEDDLAPLIARVDREMYRRKREMKKNASLPVDEI